MLHHKASYQRGSERQAKGIRAFWRVIPFRGDPKKTRWLYVNISIDLLSVISGFTPSAVLSPAFNEITLRDKAVTPLNVWGKHYVPMGWAKINIHYTRSGLAKLLPALFPSSWLRDTNILHFWEYFAFFLKPSRSFKYCCKSMTKASEGPCENQGSGFCLCI